MNSAKEWLKQALESPIKSQKTKIKTINRTLSTEIEDSNEKKVQNMIRIPQKLEQVFYIS